MKKRQKPTSNLKVITLEALLGTKERLQLIIRQLREELDRKERDLIANDGALQQVDELIDYLTKEEQGK